MPQTNMDVRLTARMSGIPLWQLAKQLGISEATLYRKLRYPLNETERQRYFDALNRITAARAVTFQAKANQHGE